MTFREKIGDLISGGKLTASRKEVEKWEMRFYGMQNSHIHLLVAVLEIEEGVTNQKSGTAKKVARMCREALDY